MISDTTHHRITADKPYHKQDHLNIFKYDLPIAGILSNFYLLTDVYNIISYSLVSDDIELDKVICKYSTKYVNDVNGVDYLYLKYIDIRTDLCPYSKLSIYVTTKSTIDTLILNMNIDFSDTLEQKIQSSHFVYEYGCLRIKK
jgi:hypothetical protein